MKEVELPVVPRKRKWVICPKCGQRFATVNEYAVCRGLYSKCKKCGREFEVVVADGDQVTNP